jgi:hypothetical protein
MGDGLVGKIPTCKKHNFPIGKKGSLKHVEYKPLLRELIEYLLR